MILPMVCGAGMATICSTSEVSILHMISSTGMPPRSTVSLRESPVSTRTSTKTNCTCESPWLSAQLYRGSSLGSHKNAHHTVDEQSLWHLTVLYTRTSPWYLSLLPNMKVHHAVDKLCAAPGGTQYLLTALGWRCCPSPNRPGCRKSVVEGSGSFENHPDPVAVPLVSEAECQPLILGFTFDHSGTTHSQTHFCPATNFGSNTQCGVGPATMKLLQNFIVLSSCRMKRTFPERESSRTWPWHASVRSPIPDTIQHGKTACSVIALCVDVLHLPHAAAPVLCSTTVVGALPVAQEARATLWPQPSSVFWVVDPRIAVIIPFPLHFPSLVLHHFRRPVAVVVQLRGLHARSASHHERCGVPVSAMRSSHRKQPSWPPDEFLP